MLDELIKRFKNITAGLRNATPVAILVLALLFSSPAKALLFDVPANANASSDAGMSTSKIVLMSVGGAVLAGIIGALLIGSGGSDSNDEPQPKPEPDIHLVSIKIKLVKPQLMIGATQQFTATGAYSDGTKVDLTKKVTWTSGDPKVASISNAKKSHGLATAKAIGKTHITATITVGGVKFRDEQKLTVVTNVVLQSIEVTPIQPSIPNGFTQQFIATGIYSNQTTADLTNEVVWTSSRTKVAKINHAKDMPGLVTAKKAGKTTITATMTNAIGKVISDSQILIVTNATLTAVEVTPIDASVPYGFAQQFTATGIFDDETTLDLTQQVNWSSDNSGIATISNKTKSKGLATANTAGIAHIAATITIGGATFSDMQPFVVTNAVLQAIAVTPVNPSVAYGRSRQFTAMGSFSDGSVFDVTKYATWSSAHTNIAEVSNVAGSKGLATAKIPGTTNITAAITLNGVTFSDTQLLTVNNAVLRSIAVTPVSPKTQIGSTKYFTATGTYSDGRIEDLTKSVTWTSSNAGIAEISDVIGSKGRVIAKAIGTTTITAIDPSTAIKNSQLLTVDGAVLVSITITPGHPNIVKGIKQQFVATGAYNDGSTEDITESVLWASDNINVIEISNAEDSEGLAIAKALGSANITAQMPHTSVSASMPATVVIGIVFSDVNKQVYLNDDSFGVLANDYAVSSVAVGSNGNIYAGTGSSSNCIIWQYNLNALAPWRQYSNYRVLSALATPLLAVDAFNNAYYGIHTGAVLVQESWSSGTQPVNLGIPDESGGAITAICVTKDTEAPQLYVGTVTGKVYQFIRGQQWQQLGGPRSIDNSVIKALTLDADDNLYAGTEAGNVYQWSGSSWGDNILPGDARPVVALAAKEFNIYALKKNNTKADVYARLNSVWRVSEELPNAAAVSMAVSSSGQVYVGSGDEVYQYDFSSNMWTAKYHTDFSGIVNSIAIVE